MMWLLWIGIGLVGTPVAIGLMLAIIGRGLPPDHVASCSVRIKQPPEAVWKVVADTARYASWAWSVNRVERLADRNGNEVWKQVMGRNAFVLETTRIDPPRRLERTIAEDRMFGGTWTYELVAESGGTRVRLTERGRVKAAIPRAMMKLFFGYHHYMAKHLESLAQKFGEPQAVSDRTVG